MNNTKKVWHVFADGLDDFYPTRKQAEKAYQALDKNEYPNARLYVEPADDDDSDVTENCLRSRGDYPW